MSATYFSNPDSPPDPNPRSLPAIYFRGPDHDDNVIDGEYVEHSANGNSANRANRANRSARSPSNRSPNARREYDDDLDFPMPDINLPRQSDPPEDHGGGSKGHRLLDFFFGQDSAPAKRELWITVFRDPTGWGFFIHNRLAKVLFVSVLIMIVITVRNLSDFIDLLFQVAF